jgi:diaminobutyrate-2-oxoglutarate transaminase
MKEFWAEFRKLGRVFGLLWAGETALDFGAALMEFALGVWIYQQTGSAEQFSLVYLSATLPALFLMPLAGALADQFDRRWVIAIADAAQVLMILTLCALFFSHRLVAYQLYIFASAGAIIGSVRTPSYQASVSAVLPADTLTRASGMMGLGQALLALIAPMLAGGLMAYSGLGGVLVIELCLLMAGAIVIFRAFTRSGSLLGRPVSDAKRNLLKGFFGGLAPALAFFRKEPLMRGLLVYVAIHDGMLVLVSAMFTPLVLATHPPTSLGIIDACGAAGAIVGSILLVVANAQKKLMVWVLALNGCLSLCILVAGLYTSTVVWSICAFLALLTGSASGSCAMALWMRKTPKENQGSIFSLLGVCQLLVASVVVLAAGQIGENVLEPALLPGGAWATSVGSWLGTGKGRGLGLLFIIAGGISTLISFLTLLGSSLRSLDELVSDMSEPVIET